MKLAAYAAAALPSAPVIWGERLRPLTLGHALTLTRIGSPFMGGACGPDGLPGDGDLLAALAICSSDPFTPPSRARLEWLWVKHCWRGEAQRLDAKAALLGYMRVSFSTPPTLPGEGDASTAPSLLQALCIALQGRLNMTWEAALATPVTRAIANVFQVWSDEGLVRIKTDAMLAADRKLEEVKALLAAGRTPDQIFEAARRKSA